MNQQLIDYIKKARTRGLHDDVILQALTGAGWQSSDVSAALSVAPTEEKIVPRPNQKQPIPVLPILVGILLLCIGSAVGYYLFRQKSDASPRVSDYLPKGSPTAAPKAEGPMVLAYVSRSTEASAASAVQVRFYDVAHNVPLPPIAEIDAVPSKVIELGHWSSDGRYLPILVLSDNNHYTQVPALSTIYLYDAATNAVRQIHSVQNPTYSKETWMIGPFAISQRWSRDGQMVVDSVPNGTGQETNTYVSMDGTVSSRVTDRGVLEANDSLMVKLMLVSPVQPLEVSSISVRGVSTSVRPKGQVVGVIGNKLVSLLQPTGPILSISDSGVASASNYLKFQQAVQEWQKEGLTQEQIAQKTYNLIKPVQDHILYFTDITTGAVVSHINFPSDQWITTTAQVVPGTEEVMLRQENRSAPPTIERYLVTDPSQKDGYRVLFEQPEDRAASNLIAEERMYSESDFSLTADGNWLAEYKGNAGAGTTASNIYLRNIKSGQEIPVCLYCSDLRVFDPTVLTAVY